jgi:iron complex outermembrane recepter protein
MKELLYHMRSSAWLILFWLVGTTKLFAQESSPDTVKQLKEIVIQAYSLEKPLSEVAASVGHIETSDLTRFSETNLLPAINTIPGVRMEERSPGSYRFSIRGSLLRSPFGVRNVKVYWNGLPLTDGGGNTYLNLLDVNSIGSVEIIKGPAGSMYGAGTGGAVLLEAPRTEPSKIQIGYTRGTYDTRATVLGLFHENKLSMVVALSPYQNSRGYRENASMRRQFLNLNFKYEITPRDELELKAFGTFLSYETPGGLTKIQYDTLPTQARPSGATSPGAVEQAAGVTNVTNFGGLSYRRNWNSKWSTRVVLFVSATDFANPTIRNYEKRDEKNFGARLENRFEFLIGERENDFILGAEYQNFDSPLRVFDNNMGAIGNLQTEGDLSSDIFFAFAQSQFELNKSWFVTAGISLNKLVYQYNRSSSDPFEYDRRNFDAIICPRIALLKKVNDFSFYGNISRGYSPPSLAEVRPSTDTYNETLKSEDGVNYEIGSRGMIKDFSFDISLYTFSLNNTIVIQRTSDGADFFVNAGETDQRGVESFLTWNPIQERKTFISDLKIWNSSTFNHYRFDEYTHIGVDYAGKDLTGVPKTVSTLGVDVIFGKVVYLNVTGNYVDRIPLNDANTEYAEEYFLLGARTGVKRQFKNNDSIEIFFGVDNALDQKYSLGNDLNAIGGRYFNAAPGINFYVGLKYTLQ